MHRKQGRITEHYTLLIMKTIKFCMIAAAAVLVMGSCASKKELVAAQSKLETCQSDNNNMQVELAKYQAQNKALETQVSEKNAAIAEMKEGMKVLQQTLDNSINQGGANISKLVDEINAPGSRCPRTSSTRCC